MKDISTELVSWVRTKLDDAGHDVSVTEYKRKQGVGTPCVIISPEFQGDSAELLSGPAGYHVTEIEVVSFASTSAAAFTHAEVIRAALQGYKGTIGTASVLSVTSTEPFEKDVDKPLSGGNSLVYSVARSYRIGHN